MSTEFDFVSHQARAWEQIRELFESSHLMATPPQTADGPGATVEATEVLRSHLSRILAEYHIGSMLDAACGDWNWLRYVDLTGVSYTGWDVDPGRVQRCRWRIIHGDYASENAPNARFDAVNLLTTERVARYDLILCRQFLSHLPNEYILAVLNKFIASGSTYLLVSNWPGVDNHFDYEPYSSTWLGYLERPVDLEAEPFCLRGKIEAIPEPRGPYGILKVPGHELALFRL